MRRPSKSELKHRSRTVTDRVVKDLVDGDPKVSALWRRVVEEFPEARSGDMGFDDIARLEDRLREAIQPAVDVWVYYNVEPPEGYDD